MNKQLLLKQRPYGEVDDNTWSVVETEIPSIGEGEFLLKIKYVSLDPAMRGWMDDRKSYLPPVGIGEVMRAGSVGEVVESNNENYKVGDWVVGWHGVQQYAVSNGAQCHNVTAYQLPPEKFLGVLGMPGYTAYFGLLEVGQPKEGETLLVSGAAGAVGSVVGQIGKIKGLTVIGIAGGEEKCKYCVEELGFDLCLDYKSETFVNDFIANTKSGIDVYFDNVGGEILDLALARLNFKARVALCGAISQYNSKASIKGPANYLSLLINRAKMEGFIVMDYAAKYNEAAMNMGQWMMEGKLKSREHIEKGIENFPEVFTRLFSGKKKGKLLLEV